MMHIDWLWLMPNNFLVLTSSVVLALAGCSNLSLAQENSGECIYGQVARNASTWDRYLVCDEPWADDKISISDINSEVAKLIIAAYVKGIKERPLVYEGVVLNSIVVNRVFELPLGEIIIGFTCAGEHYSVEFDYKSGSFLNLSKNVLD